MNAEQIFDKIMLGMSTLDFDVIMDARADLDEYYPLTINDSEYERLAGIIERLLAKKRF